MKAKTTSEDLSDVFTPEGIAALKQGQLLRFDYEGSMIEFIVSKLNRKSGKVWGKRITTYHPDEVDVVDAKKQK